jgi:hypothetical protein
MEREWWGWVVNEVPFGDLLWKPDDEKLSLMSALAIVVIAQAANIAQFEASQPLDPHQQESVERARQKIRAALHLKSLYEADDQ